MKTNIKTLLERVKHRALSWLDIYVLEGRTSGAAVGVTTLKCQISAPEPFRTAPSL